MGHRLLVAKQMSEGCLEEIGPVERAIRSLDFADLGPVLDRQVPLAAQQGEAGALDCPLSFGILLLAHLGAANLIHRVGSQALHVEAIENDPGLRCVLLDRLDVAFGHVEGDDLDLPAPLGAEFLRYSVVGAVGALAAIGLLVVVRYREPRLIAPIIAVSATEITEVIRPFFPDSAFLRIGCTSSINLASSSKR